MSWRLLPVLLLPASLQQLPTPPQTPQRPPWRSPVAYPDGMESFKGTKYTQSIYVSSNRAVIEKVRTDGLAKKWRTSGGMVGVKGVTSEKFRLIPGTVKTWVGGIDVDNGLGSFQRNLGVLRSYPDGTRFDDVLSNSDGVVFEHRVREKRGGKWFSRVAYKDDGARPKDYHGLTVGCATCHNDSGSGNYGRGLVPGGDTVISDPMDWTVARHLLPER